VAYLDRLLKSDLKHLVQTLKLLEMEQFYSESEKADILMVLVGQELLVQAKALASKDLSLRKVL